MSSVQYVPQIDEAEEEEEFNHSTIYSQISSRGRYWPHIIGSVEIVVGMIITLLGFTEVFFIPMLESKDGNDLILFNEKTCYGSGIFAGIMLVLTGSTFIRASLSQRNTTIYRFFHLTILSLIVYSGLTTFLIIAYSKGWTTTDKYPPLSSLPEVHFFVTLFTCLGLLFAATGFMQYFNDICCGDRPLWVPWVRFFKVLCCCLKARKQHHFENGMEDDLHSRSNPI